MSLSVPVVIFLFRRIDTLPAIFERLSQVKPTKLYLMADCGRNDEDKCQLKMIIFQKFHSFLMQKSYWINIVWMKKCYGFVGQTTLKKLIMNTVIASQSTYCLVDGLRGNTSS